MAATLLFLSLALFAAGGFVMNAQGDGGSGGYDDGSGMPDDYDLPF